MPVLKPRTRVVYFRISEHEYKEYVAACRVHGAQCLSDLARTALRSFVSAGQPGSVESRLGGIEKKLETLLKSERR